MIFFIFALFTEPKDDYAYKFFIPWLGKITRKIENDFFINLLLGLLLGVSSTTVKSVLLLENKLKHIFLTIYSLAMPSAWHRHQESIKTF